MKNTNVKSILIAFSLIVCLFLIISSVSAKDSNLTDNENVVNSESTVNLQKEVNKAGGLKDSIENITSDSLKSDDVLSSSNNSQMGSSSDKELIGSSGTLTINSFSSSSFSFSYRGQTDDTYTYWDDPSGTVTISCDGYSNTFTLTCYEQSSGVTSSTPGYAWGTASGSISGNFKGKCTVTASMTITTHSYRNPPDTVTYTHTATASFDLTKIATSLSAISVSSSSYEYAGSNGVILSGRLNGYDSRYAASVVIKRGSVEVGTAEVGSDGSWSYTVPTDSVNPGSYTYTVSFGGNDKYQAASSSQTSSSITVNKGNPILTFSQSDSVNVCPGGVKITVTAKNALNSVLSGITITPSGTNIGTDSAVTDSNGQVSFTVSNLNASTHTWSFTTTENTQYKSASNSNSFTVNKIAPTLSEISLNTNSYVYLDPQNLVLSGILNGVNSLYAPGTVTILRGGNVIGTSELNSTGGWSFTVLSSEVIPGTYTYTVSFGGNDYYNQATSKSVNVDVLKLAVDLGSASTTNYRFNNCYYSTMF